jgi:hypothetical protein
MTAFTVLQLASISNPLVISHSPVLSMLKTSKVHQVRGAGCSTSRGAATCGGSPDGSSFFELLRQAQTNLRRCPCENLESWKLRGGPAPKTIGLLMLGRLVSAAELF